MLVSIRIRNINFDFESSDDSSNIIINEVEKKSYIDKYINKIYKIEIILDDDDDFSEVLENSILELITDLSGWMISEMEYEVINDGIKEIPYTSTATKPINFTAFYKNLLKEKGNKPYFVAPEKDNRTVEEIVEENRDTIELPTSKYRKAIDHLPTPLDIIKLVYIEFIASALCNAINIIPILQQIDKNTLFDIEEVVYDILGDFDYYSNDEDTDEKDSMRDRVLEMLGYTI